tara:strand:+ start:286 stop:648 length:363 start_codon:yes stop_codon:yes gene_type:complete
MVNNNKENIMTMKVNIETELKVAEERIRDFIETIPAGKTAFWVNFRALIRENKLIEKYNGEMRLSRANLPKWFKYHFGLTGQRLTIEKKLREVLRGLDISTVFYQENRQGEGFKVVGLRK